tara:strand:- start:8784 stop:9500 length:717 start_codon:yes stop_codon:yes gene_type:complete
MHLIEASRALPDQMRLWAESLGEEGVARPDSMSLTHVHIGHVDGLGQFGKEIMGVSDLPLYASSSVIAEMERREAMHPFRPSGVDAMKGFEPSEGCGFELVFVPVPHRDEFADTHAILVRGSNRSVLFLPDHDKWDATLAEHGAGTIREWFSMLGVDIALIDGSFWDSGELPGRDMSQIPHPTVTESLMRLGKRSEGDPEIYFIHLNHSNPLLKQGGEYDELIGMGWGVSRQGQHFSL